MRRFRKFRDDRFALTTVQNPLREVRTYAELVQAAQRERENQLDAAEIPAPQPPATPPSPAPQVSLAPQSSFDSQCSPIAVAPAPLATDDPPTAPDQSTATLTPLAPTTAVAPGDQVPEPTNRHTTEIVIPMRKAVTKRAKRRPPCKSPRRSKKFPLAEVIPAGDASQYVAEIFDRRFTNADRPHGDEGSELGTLERHARKCAICIHPDRADLEEDFVSWRNAELIQKDYDLPNFRTIYTHARATGLYERRRQNLRFAAELLIEHADQAKPGPDTILRAIHTCAHLNGRGGWVEPTKRVIISSGAHAPSAEPASESEPASRQLEPENAPHPQLSAPVSISSDKPERFPHFLIDSPAIRK